jgi:pimeloyl-ACP methyl ester carboxylesterase
MKKVLLLLLLTSLPAFAADYEREKRWAEEVVPGLVVGDAVYLAQAAGPKFLGLFTKGNKPGVAVLLVHGKGMHPDWALNGALRTGLNDLGYTTLSLQMPVLAADAKTEDYDALFPEAVARIAAGVTDLKARGFQRIALVSHSLGSRMTNAYFTAGADPAVAAWIAIGIPRPYLTPERFSAPVLDIYGENDFPEIVRDAAVRATALAPVNGSAQERITGSDHFFNGREAELVKRSVNFLAKTLGK